MNAFNLLILNKMDKITTFKQIKKIIKPIPAEGFCENVFSNGTQCCFIGHINTYISKDLQTDRGGYGARTLTENFLLEAHNVHADGATVNNTTNINGYNEPVIKDRLMHMIEDGIIWENKKKWYNNLPTLFSKK